MRISHSLCRLVLGIDGERQRFAVRAVTRQMVDDVEQQSPTPSLPQLRQILAAPGDTLHADFGQLAPVSTLATWSPDPTAEGWLKEYVVVVMAVSSRSAPV